MVRGCSAHVFRRRVTSRDAAAMAPSPPHSPSLSILSKVPCLQPTKPPAIVAGRVAAGCGGPRTAVWSATAPVTPLPVARFGSYWLGICYPTDTSISRPSSGRLYLPSPQTGRRREAGGGRWCTGPWWSLRIVLRGWRRRSHNPGPVPAALVSRAAVGESEAAVNPNLCVDRNRPAVLARADTSFLPVDSTPVDY